MPKDFFFVIVDLHCIVRGITEQPYYHSVWVVVTVWDYTTSTSLKQPLPIAIHPSWKKPNYYKSNWMNVQHCWIVLVPLFLFNFRLHWIKILKQSKKPISSQRTDCAYLEWCIKAYNLHCVAFAVSRVTWKSSYNTSHQMSVMVQSGLDNVVRIERAEVK